MFQKVLQTSLALAASGSCWQQPIWRLTRMNQLKLFYTTLNQCFPPSGVPSSTHLTFCRHMHNAPLLYAGHSHWANIKEGKEAKDANRASNFSRMRLLIDVAIRAGGPDPKLNNPLARLIDDARAMNMPKDTLQRMLTKKAAGTLKPSMYEIKGPASSLMIVEAMTSNARKTEIDLRSVIKKLGGQMLDNAGLMHSFNHKGVILASRKNTSEDTAIDDGIAVGVEEVVLENADQIKGQDQFVAEFRFECNPQHIANVKNRLEAAGYDVVYADEEYEPLQPLELGGSDAEMFKKMYDKIEENPDITRIVTNVVFSSELE